jgi:hypothetical protein
MVSYLSNDLDKKSKPLDGRCVLGLLSFKPLVEGSIPSTIIGANKRQLSARKVSLIFSPLFVSFWLTRYTVHPGVLLVTQV